MLNLFRRTTKKLEPSAPQKEGGGNVPAPPSNAFDQMEVIARCIENFMDNNTFAGGLDAAPGYRAQAMPNGIQVAANRDKRIGAVLDRNIFAMSVAGVPAVTLGMAAASGYFANYHKHEPNWQIRSAPGGPQSMEADMPFGSRNMLHMDCKDEPVDTQFDGQNEPGCTLMITVRPRS